MKWILGLSRYPVFQPQNTPNTRKRILSPIMPCFRGFGVFRGSLIFGDKSQYMVAAPSSRVGRGESEGKSRVRLIVFSPDVANCRQTVDALLAPHHRLAADDYDSTADDSPSPDVATCRQTVEALLATHHRLAADGYDSKADDSRSPAVATCRQTAEALLAPLSTDWQRMATGNDPKEKGLLLPTPLSR
jgi:hypothetical protein